MSVHFRTDSIQGLLVGKGGNRPAVEVSRIYNEQFAGFVLHTFDRRGVSIANGVVSQGDPDMTVPSHPSLWQPQSAGGPPATPLVAAPQDAVRISAPAASGIGRIGHQQVFAFNVGSQDVTVIDATTHQVLSTNPLGASVRWLSNEQRYFDGQLIWTYDFPQNQLQAIAIDPQAITVVKRIPTGTPGPGQSLMLSHDQKRAYLNSAGSNVLNVVDLQQGAVVQRIQTGHFPWDLHISPDGRFGYIPERDQDTVAKLDMSSGAIVQRVQFPTGSKPFMLRVSPNGKEVWVQATAANTNTILDAQALSVKASAVDGISPVTNAWSPDGRYVLLTHEGDATLSIYSQPAARVVKRLDLGADGANIGFTADSRTAFVAVTGANSVAVIDLNALAVTSQIPVGQWPAGLIVFPPPAAG